MESIRLELPLENIIKIPVEKTDNAPAVFFLHGFGSNMQDLFSLSSFFPNEWYCISLQATIPVQFNGWAWCELNFDNLSELPDPDQIRVHSRKVLSCIDVCINQLNLDPKRITILGFSQGASLSLYCGLTLPRRFHAIVALSGVITKKYFYEEFDLNNINDLKVFMGFGKQDLIIPISLAQQVKHDLISLGLKPSYNEYDADHTISNDCLNDFLIWLKELPS